MSEEQNKLDQVPQIIDVEFLPTLDDEDYQREKAEQSSTAKEEPSIHFEEAREEEVKIEEPKTNTYEKVNEESSSKEKRDTSYASFDTAQKQAFRQKKRKFSASLASGIGLALAILIGLPFAAFVGFFVVLGIGMAVFFCGLAFGMGVLGLGVAGFTAVAGMGQIGMLCLFGSLLAIGGGGLGFCLVALIFIWIKRLWVYVYRRLTHKRERGVA